MKRYWHETNPELYEQTKAEVGARYPTLHFSVREHIVYLNGTLQIKDERGMFDFFHIEVELPPKFPDILPIVREVGGRIPHTVERHIFPNGNTCLHVNEDWYFEHPNGYTLCEFLDGPMYSFFLQQSAVEHGQPWPFGQRSHGMDGILECYKDLTDAPNLSIARAFLETLAKQEVKGHHLCPCGSGKKIRECHPKLREFGKRIPRKVAIHSWIQVQRLRAGRAT